MSRTDRTTRDGEPKAAQASNQLSLGLLLGASLAVTALTLFLGFLTWNQTRSVNERFSGLENRLAQLSTKVDQVSARAGAPPQRGPDPNRVYTVKTEGSPFKGAAEAPVTIAEFSDFQ